MIHVRVFLINNNHNILHVEESDQNQWKGIRSVKVLSAHQCFFVSIPIMGNLIFLFDILDEHVYFG